jgi:hypothetical protein
MAKAVTDSNRFVVQAIHLAVEDGGRRYLTRDLALKVEQEADGDTGLNL